MQRMELLSFYLPGPFDRARLEAAIGTSLKKSIEATYYAQIGEALITYSQFHVVTLINWTREATHDLLGQLGGQEKLLGGNGGYQDYPVVIDPDCNAHYRVESEQIVLKNLTLISMIIIAHVVSQSVALELYERKLADYYERSRGLIDDADTYSIFKRARLARFAKQLVLIRHDLIIDLHLLDKPNILWDNEDAEMLYNTLAFTLELKERFEVVEYKLNSIKDDIIMVTDLTNHNHSSFLEWIIIVLIGVEIVMGVMEWFGWGSAH